MTARGAVRPSSAQQHAAWSQRAAPAVEQVAAGVWSIPIPVARIPIRFTYAYVIIGDGEVLLIDPGAASAEGEAALVNGLRVAGLTLSSLTGIVVTHYHFDHWEAVDEVARASGAWVAIGAEEQGWVDGLTDEVLTPAAAAARFRAHGVPAARADEFAGVEDYRFTREHARPQLLLRDGDLLPIAGERLRVLSTPGHTPGHVCIVDETRRLLFSGDHVLPGITPHVALNPFGAADPLGQYLRSLDAAGDADVDEVMPAHEYRFTGLVERVEELRFDVHRRLDEVEAARRSDPEPTPWQIASSLTWSRSWDQFGVEAQRMAVVETAAFLAYLNVGARGSSR